MTQIPFHHQFAKWIGRSIHNDLWVRRLGFMLSVAAMVSGIATYLLLTGRGGFGDKSTRVLPLIYLDLTLMLLLSVIIAKRLIELWTERKKGAAGSKLHVQIAVLFAFVAITPGVFVTVFSALFFNVGVKAWFSEPVRLALNEAKGVANAYLYERAKSIEEDALAITKEIVPTIESLVHFPDLLSERLTKITRGDRGIDEALILDEYGTVRARAFLTFALEFEKVLVDAFQRAKAGDIVILSNEKEDRVRALTRLDPDGHYFLYIGKLIDADVLRHVKQTESAISEYERLDAQRSGLQITFILFFSLVALLLLLAAVWAGLTVANLFVRPISRLITASDAISQGNLDVRVDAEGSINNELGILAKAFNHMTYQLRHQRQDLINASLQIDQRRQFMEAVLSRISAGVISVDQDGMITLINRRAQELLDIKTASPNLSLMKLLPEVHPLIEQVNANPEGVVSIQLTLMRRGITRTLQLGMVADHSRHQKSGRMPLSELALPEEGNREIEPKDPESTLHKIIRKGPIPNRPETVEILDSRLEQIFDDGSTPILKPIKGETSDEKLSKEESSKIDSFGLVGYIITFDDITPLMSAQRKAAWSDVARKIAHEIKNPLTPIQLSAERLKRKYLKEIQTDPEVFQTCIDTIVRQVGQIGRLVSEFSSFARMPEPVLVPDNLVQLCRNALDLQRQAHHEIHFSLDAREQKIFVECDPVQMGQVLTNLLQNAINAITLDEIAEDKKPVHPEISITVSKLETRACVMVDDNGPGLPVNGRERLTEPYYTTHSKGTGLGLAIVSKIIEDHRGRLELGDSPTGGARVLFELPLVTK
jgi:nitrogen fixation/metabolism regulation signal transduction histidine kinase